MLTLLLACAPPEPAPAAPPPPIVEPAPVDPFDAWRSLPPPVADGFAVPVGRGWTGCGSGCWERAAPAPVGAMAAGTVEASGPDVVRIRHAWYEDEVPTVATSEWRGLLDPPPVGAVVGRGDRLGTASHLTVVLDGADDLGGFLAAHDRLVVPGDAHVLALVSHELREMRVYTDGVETGRFPVALGQAPGAKEVRGDNRTPKGLYWIVQRSRGPFEGPVGPYYGTLWLRLNYPNRWDAARGLADGVITAAQAAEITRAFDARGPTPRDTALGSGIGIHGWNGAWRLDGSRRLSWGCIVTQPADADALHAALPDGTLVALF